jgi:SAM-dependent methyltransferase
MAGGVTNECRTIAVFPEAMMPTTPRACPVCGSTLDMVFRSVLWTELGDLWELSPEEFKYVNHQQGVLCQACGCNLRAQALGLAITQAFGHRGPFRKFVRTIRGRWLRVLEINQVGALSGHFSRLSRKELRVYPELDMMKMNLPDARYDLVIHSDTLEHIPDPVQALRECLRVLKPGGFCGFTVPIVVGRLTRSCEGRPPSYHGDPAEPREDYRVHTEYGADAWRQVIEAGFAEARIVAVKPPTAHAIVGRKSF